MYLFSSLPNKRQQKGLLTARAFWGGFATLPQKSQPVSASVPDVRGNVKLNKYVIGCFVFLFFSSALHAKDDTKLNQVTSYVDSTYIQYPGFTVRYLGLYDFKYPNNTHTFEELVFEINGKSTRQLITWGHGMGELSPTYFEMNGKKYVLELFSSYSKKFNSIADNNLIIWSYKDFKNETKYISP